MKQLLDEARALVGKCPRRFGLLQMWYNRLKKPEWMTGEKELATLYEDRKTLLKYGQVVWGQIVQANTLLFEDGNDDHPCALLYSPDPYYDDLDELQELAHELYALKDSEPEEKSLVTFAEVITDQQTYLMNAPLPALLADEREVYYTTAMVHRKHMPEGKLVSNWFPLLIHEACAAVMILPEAYWGERLKQTWLKQAWHGPTF